MQRRSSLLSISTVFFLIMLGLVLVGGSVVATWRGHQTFVQQKSYILERNTLLAGTLASTVEDFLRSAEVAIAVFAREASVEEWTPERLQALTRRFAEENRGTYLSMYLIGTDGVEIADYFPGGTTEADRVAGIGVNLSDRAYFKKAVETRRTVVSDALIGRSTKRPVVVVITPVFDDGGEVKAFAAGSLDLTAIGELGQALVGGTLLPVVIDAAGQAVAHPIPGVVQELRNLSDFEPARRALAGESGFDVEYTGVDGKVYNAAYTPLPDFGWAVWVGQDVSVFTAVSKSVVRGISIAFGSLLVMAAIAFAFVSRSLFLPLKRMTAQAEHAADGDLDTIISLDGVIPTKETVLLTERFNQMIAALKVSMEMKAQFLRVVSLAFRSPITGLRWQVESWLDRRSELSPEQAEAWEDCAKIVQRLQMGFHNVVVGQEVNQKQMKVERKPADINAVLAEVLKRMAPIASTNKVAMNVSIEALPAANADVERLDKVFEVIIANAILYSRPGSEISISANAAAKDIVVSVIDHGIGIPKDEVPRVFEPFFRGAEAVKFFPDGVGLGLFIAKAFVEAHGGTIAVQSSPGSCVVTVRIPAAAAA